MILRSLELEAFGRFLRRNFEFRRGLNLVIGPNEAGKSTLMEAVPAILFGVRDKERFQPWGRPGQCVAALQFETGEGSVQVRRDLLNDEVRLECTDQLYQTCSEVAGKASPQGRSGEKKAYLQELETLLGFRDADLFRATLFFGQGDLDLQFGKNLTERIKALLSGSSEVDYDQVLNALTEELFEVTADNPWGKDKTRDRALELTQKELRYIEEQLSSTRQQAVALARIGQELETLEAALTQHRTELKKGEKYLQWVHNYWQLEGQLEQLREQLSSLQLEESRQRELLEREQSILQELAVAGLDLPPGRQGLELRQTLQETRRSLVQLQRLQTEDRRLRDQLLKIPVNSYRLAWLCSLLLVSIGAGLAWFYQPLLIQIALATGLSVTPVWLFSVWREGRQGAQKSELRGKGQLLEQQRHELQGRLDRCQELLEAANIPFRGELLAALDQKLELHQDAFDELRDLRSALAVLPEREQLVARLKELAREVAVIEERLQKGRSLKTGVDLGADDLEEAEFKLEALRKRIREQEEKRNRLWQQQAELAGRIGFRGQVEDQRAELIEEVSRLQRRKRVLTLACEVLRNAVRQFRKNYLKRFAARANHYLKATTDGRYAELRLLDDLNIELKGRQGGWRPLDHFSQGTRDAVALAVRLGLVEQFSHGRKLPLLLDDAMVNLDAARQDQVLKLLKRVSAEHQVILFSHDERLARKAARERWHVITLESNQSMTGAENEEESHAGQLHLL